MYEKAHVARKPCSRAILNLEPQIFGCWTQISLKEDIQRKTAYIYLRKAIQTSSSTSLKKTRKQNFEYTLKLQFELIIN
jgi:hypothetical protein